MAAEIRIGKVSRINYATGMIAVTYPDQDDSVTDLLPFLTFGGEYHMPKIEQYVAVIHLSTGAEMPPVYGKDFFRKEFSNTAGAAYMEHDPDEEELTIKAGKIKFKTDAGTVTVAEIIAAIGGGA